MVPFEFDRRELRILSQLRKPDRIQRFLDDEVGYNVEPRGATCYSPRLVLRNGVAHCMEGALLAAAALRVHGFPPLLLDLQAIRDDDHVLALFRVDGGWGAVAKSNYAGLRYREPVYRTLRELAISYLEHYYNPRGEKTLRAFSTRPVRLARFDARGWMTSREEVWYIPEYLHEVAHTRLLTPDQETKLSRMDRRLYDAGRVGLVEHGPVRPSGAPGGHGPQPLLWPEQRPPGSGSRTSRR